MPQGPAQAALFDARWLVQAPYVSDNLADGCWREPRAKAIARRYVQLNSPGLVWCVVIDVDHDDADWAADRAGLPEPSWTAVNPFNGHAHVAYILEVPVARSDVARTAPLRYLARVEAGAQGEHKLARGYLPAACHSLHWFAHPGFRDAVAQYQKAEGRAVAEEIEVLASYGPFKRGKED